MKKYKVTLIPLTAIHIGTGQELDLFSYTVKDGFFYRFSIEKLLSNINEEIRKRLNEFIEKADLKELAKIFHDYIDDRSILYKIPVTKSFEEKFKSKLEDPNNQLLVYEMYRSLDDYSPVIPGSSIKGAIRTAIVSIYGENKSHSDLFYRDRNNKEKPKDNFENIILNYKDAKNDPFRAIHITDCKINGDKAQIVGEIVNYKPNRRRGNDISPMQIIMERIRGICMNGNAIGEFELTIDDNLQNLRLNDFSINIKLVINEIIKNCDKFYKNHLAEESKNFYKESNINEIKNMRVKLLTKVKEIDPSKNECLIRVGRHSHIENVTIDKHRTPKGGTSRFLTEDGLFPLGFAKLKFEEIKT